MKAGKGAKRSTSGSAGKKTTYLDEINHAVVSLLPKEDDSSQWVSTLAPLTLLKVASKHAVTLNENRILYNVSDATKVAMVTPSIVNFGLQKGGGCHGTLQARGRLRVTDSERLLLYGETVLLRSNEIIVFI